MSNIVSATGLLLLVAILWLAVHAAAVLEVSP